MMKSGITRIILVSFVIMALSVSFVSAGILDDFFDRFTGGGFGAITGMISIWGLDLSKYSTDAYKQATTPQPLEPEEDGDTPPEEGASCATDADCAFEQTCMIGGGQPGFCQSLTDHYDTGKALTAKEKYAEIMNLVANHKARANALPEPEAFPGTGDAAVQLSEGLLADIKSAKDLGTPTVLEPEEPSEGDDTIIPGEYFPFSIAWFKNTAFPAIDAEIVALEAIVCQKAVGISMDFGDMVLYDGNEICQDLAPIESPHGPVYEQGIF